MRYEDVAGFAILVGLGGLAVTAVMVAAVVFSSFGG